MRPGPGIGRWIPLTFHTRVTLDFSNPFAQPPPPPPPQGEEDLMDIDLPGDYILHDAREDSNQESYPAPVLVYSPLPEGGTANNPLVILSDSKQSDDDGTRLDEMMTDLEGDAGEQHRGGPRGGGVG